MSEAFLARMSRVRVLRKCLGKPFLLVNEWVWNSLSSSLRETYPLYLYGSFLHFLVKLRSPRTQYHGTYFLRNRPELELIQALVHKRAIDSSKVRMLVLACSNGAEVYSILWTIRSVLADLTIIMNAVDISPDILETAKEGLYSLRENRLINSMLFERLCENEMRAIFDRETDNVRVKPWIREGINWQVADARDPAVIRMFGEHDIVVANKFLCHMNPSEAEECLRNIAGLVKPGGYLAVSGIDLDIRTKVALDLGWLPVGDLLEEIHNGDPSVRRDWPWRYWGLEPFTRKRRDWSVRYASVFQCIGQPKPMGSVSAAGVDQVLAGSR
jgi:SAM-dependent methyltransferase